LFALSGAFLAFAAAPGSMTSSQRFNTVAKTVHASFMRAVVDQEPPSMALLAATCHECFEGSKQQAKREKQ
jgi:hypothetical protein